MDEPTGQSTSQPMNDEKMVPYARLQEALSERNTLREQLIEARAQAAAWASERGAYEGRVRELEERATWAGHEASLAREGIADRDVVDYVRYQYGRAEKSKDGSLPEFGGWWQKYRDSKPAVLAPFLGGQAPRPTGAGTAVEAGARAVGAGTKADPASMTSEQYRAWRATPEGQAELKAVPFKPRG